MKAKLIRLSTIPSSLNVLLKGQLKFLAQYFDVIGISSDGVDLEIVKEREGIKTIAVEMERGISPIKDLLALLLLFKHFKKERPLLVHSITPKAGLLSMLAGKMAGVPIRMHTFTGLIFPTKSGWIKKLLIKMDQLLCWSATHIYPEGSGVKNDLLAYKITTKPLRILANGNVNGIDLEFFNSDLVSEIQQLNLREELGFSERDFIFIFVGRLVGDKGINELIEAFKNLNCPNTKLLLVGPYESVIDPLHTKTLKEIETNLNIVNVGFQKDVRPYFTIANALAFPSYREGFPNVVIQAGAMNLPCIVSDINGCNEIVIEGQNGMIIPSKNVEALVKAMLHFVNDKAFYSHLQLNARRMIEERYDQRVVWDALVIEYKLLLDSLQKQTDV